MEIRNSEHATKLINPTVTKLTWIAENIPVANLLYDLFLDEAPSFSAVKELLNLFALMSTLLLGINIAIASSISFDELQQADLLWTNTTGYYNDFWISAKNPFMYVPVYTPSVAFSKVNTVCFYFLLTSLLIVVVVYMDGLAKGEPGVPKDVQREMEELWWRWCRFPVFSSLTALWVGIIYLHFSYTAMVMIKYPSRRCSPFTHYSTNEECVYPWTDATGVSIMSCFLVPTFILVGLGTSRRYRAMRA